MREHETIWYASRTSDDNATVPTYAKPQQIVLQFNYFTVVPAISRGYMEVMKYGETLTKTWTAIANANHFYGMFKEGDVFYVDGATPNQTLEEMYGYGCSANAVAKSVLPVRNTISITLEVNQAEVKQ